MKQIGIEDFQTIYVEGVAEHKEQAQEIKNKALEQATKLAKNF